jgi:hypothetical protein
MARKPVLVDARAVTFSIESDLHAAAKAKATELGLSGFSEYVAKLLNRDLTRKGSAAEGISRHMRRARS